MSLCRVRCAFQNLLLCVALLQQATCTAPPPPEQENRPPTADAGAARTVNGGSQVQLDGTGSTDPDGDDLSFSWIQTAGPSVGLQGAFSPTPSFVAPNMNTSLRFALEVADREGLTSVDTVVITVVAVSNVAPRAEAGVDQAVGGGSIVTLDGSGSSDPDGEELVFFWLQTSGPAATLSDPQSEIPVFLAPNTDATLVFELTVTDGIGNSSSDSVSILITRVPPQLFVMDVEGDQVASWREPRTVDGNTAPTHVLSGSNTRITAPVDAVVTDFNSLVVSLPADNALLFFRNGASASGNVEPSFVVQGNATKLDRPGSMAYLPVFDLLFVANSGGDFDILVFHAPSTLPSNDLPPARTISSAMLSAPTGLALDVFGNLYVANNGAGNVIVFANAQVADGPTTPARTISSAAFDGPFDVFVDRSDNLFVMETGGVVHVFANASAADGETSPTHSFAVSGAQLLGAIVVADDGVGYLTDVDAVAVYSLEGVAGLSGVQAPVRTIAGPATGLVRPLRMFLLDR